MFLTPATDRGRDSPSHPAGTDIVNEAAAQLGGSHGGLDSINVFDISDVFLVRVANTVEYHGPSRPGVAYKTVLALVG
jgi:hypothetical protein